MKKLEINGINFDLPERYEPIKLIGKGTYGAVVSAIDNLNKEKVAIKKLSKIEDMVSCIDIRIKMVLIPDKSKLKAKLNSHRSMLKEFLERSKS